MKDEIKDKIQDLLKGGSFESIDSLNEKVAALMEKENEMAQDDFLGLSPDQVHRLIHFPFDQTEDIVSFNTAQAPEALASIPVVADAMLFLNTMADSEPLKATGKGFLPLKVAKFLHHEMHSMGYIGSISSEEQSPHLYTLRLMLEMCGWIKKRKKAFTLTARGRRIAEKGFNGETYLELFRVYTGKFNWGFRDAYPEAAIIQHSFLFSFIILKRFASDFISADEIAACFIRAFPMVLNEIEPDTHRNSTQILSRMISLRLLERFCEHFGLVELHRENKYSWPSDGPVKTTKFFDAFLDWRSGI